MRWKKGRKVDNAHIYFVQLDLVEVMGYCQRKGGKYKYKYNKGVASTYVYNLS